MKKSVIKLIAAFVAAITVLSLASCAEKKSAENSDTAEIVVWTNYSHSKDTMTKLIDEYNNSEGKEKGIKIVYEVKGGDTYSQALELAIQTGAEPDLFNTSVADSVEKNLIVALEDLPGTEDLLAKFKPYLRDFYNTYNGKTYRLPTSATTRGLVYNKEMFKAAGIIDEKGEAKPPVTWDEFCEDAKKLTNVSKQEYGVVLPMKWGGWFDSDIIGTSMASIGYSQGYNPVTGEYDFAPIKPIMEAFLKLKEDGSFLPGAESLDNDAARARFSDGKVGMKFAYSFDVGVYNDQFPTEIDWGVAPLPVVDENNVFYQPMDFDSSIAIGKKAFDTKDHEKLAEVVKFFASDKLLTELYKEGLNIPYDFSLVKDVKLENAKKGWEEFAKLLEISKVTPVVMKNDIGSATTIDQNFINKVWVGKMSAEDALAEETKIRNEGKKTYADMHPEYKPEKYIIPDWDAKREK